jgi:adenylate kinase family enzyme
MTPPDYMHRVSIVGTSCSGKSTLAEKLSVILDQPHINLDALHWGPNWTPRPEFAEDVAKAIEPDRWIIDGNYRAVREVVHDRTTDFVWLNLPFRIVFSRAIRRTCSRIRSKEMYYNGNRETIRGAFLQFDGIPWWVIRTHGKRRREYPALFALPQYQRARVHELTTPREVTAFVSKIRDWAQGC